MDDMTRRIPVEFACFMFAATLAVGGPPAPGVRRESPPTGITATALDVGKPALSFALPSVNGDRFVLSHALKKRGVAIVFYRGYW